MSVFSRAMWRALAPYLTVGFLLLLGAGYLYENGAPAWVVHLAAIVGALVLAPVCVRWDKRTYGD
jgi:hypothetical protein